MYVSCALSSYIIYKCRQILISTTFYITEGNSPLLEAVAQGHGPIVPYLLNAGADPLVRNNAGETGLHLAAIQGNLDHVKV